MTGRAPWERDWQTYIREGVERDRLSYLELRRQEALAALTVRQRISRWWDVHWPIVAMCAGSLCIVAFVAWLWEITS